LDGKVALRELIVCRRHSYNTNFSHDEIWLYIRYSWTSLEAALGRITPCATKRADNFEALAGSADRGCTFRDWQSKSLNP
jgi:hypothetical protein